MIPACRLWEKLSAKGNRYLIGRLGGVRVLVMPNTRPESGDDSTHTLFFTDAPQRSQVAPVEPSHPAPVHRRARRGGEKQQIDDDPVPF
jgi:hypothetical protein